MIKLTSAASHGICLVMYMLNLEDKETPVRLQDIATTLEMSQPFLEQIARKLRIAGIIDSVRGPVGGYRLQKKVRKVGPTLGDVINACKKPAIERTPVGSAECTQMLKIVGTHCEQHDKTLNNVRVSKLMKQLETPCKQ